MLRVTVFSGYSGERGSYVLEGGVLRWEGKDGRPDPYPTGPDRAPDRGILATDDYRDGWIECGPDPERWLRRLPGFFDMRGHMYARIVEDT